MTTDYSGYTYDDICDIDNGVFDRPIRSEDEDEWVKRVEKVHKGPGVSQELDLNLLKRSALLIKNRDLFQKVTSDQNDLTSVLSTEPETSEEKAALDREADGNLRSLTRTAITTLLLCATAAAAQGMVQETIVGANVEFPAAPKMNLAVTTDAGRLQWINNGLIPFSFINAVPYLTAGILGAWLSDPLTYAFGRRATLCFAGVCTFAASIGTYYSQRWWDLLICRIVQGVGIGSKSSVVPVIIAETFPPEFRGRLLTLWQISVSFGIFIGSCTNIIFRNSWRAQLGICFASTLPLLAICFAVPESPRWLIKRGKYGSAIKALRELRETPLQAARDFLIIYESIQLERSLLQNTMRRRENTQETDPNDLIGNSVRSFFWRFPGLFSIRRVSRAALAACVVMFSQQACGINLFAFLSTTIIQQSGIVDQSHLKTLGFNVGFGAANFVASAATFWLFEYWGEFKHLFGRRALLLSSLLFMFPFLIATGVVMDRQPAPELATVTVLVIMYTFIYSPGAGIVPFLYAAEVFPQDFREVGMSLSCSVNFLCAFILAIAVPQFTETQDDQVGLPHNRYKSLFGSFAALDLFAAGLVFLFMRAPEPRATLGDINVLFSASTRRYIEFQFQNVLSFLPRRQNVGSFAVWLDNNSNKEVAP